MAITNGFYQRLSKLENTPMLQSDIPPGSIVLPLAPLSENEQSYVLAIPAGVKCDYAPGYVLVDLAKLDWESLDVLHAIVLGEFASWIPREELEHRFLSIDENCIPKAFEDAPVATDRTGILYHLTRTEYRAARLHFLGKHFDRERLQMWCEVFAGGLE